jgi:RNA ligase (TIGR02306 family)
MFKFGKNWSQKMAELESQTSGATKPIGFEYKPKWELGAKEVSQEELAAMAKGLEPNIQTDGSIYKVPFTTIVKIDPHPNADRLSIATVYGFQVVTQKDKYKVGDRIVYVPIDSLLPKWLEDILFPEGSKITLNKSRVRQIRIRKVVSQGMIVDPEDIKSKINPEYLDIEQDLSTVLGITKYEPPQQKTGIRQQTPRNKPLENARFHKYGGVDNLRWYPNYFENQEVVIQEKLHGSCCRASFAKTSANTIWKKIQKLFGILPRYEYCHGSNNVQLQERSNYTGFYGEDVYGKVLEKVDAFSKLKYGETVFGELIGPGIQKGYEYGHSEHHFVLFDVKVEREDGCQEYLDPEQAESYAKERGFDFVPVLYKGIYNAELAKQLSAGPSVYCPKEKVREGVVIKIRNGYSHNSSKKALKLINEVYLDDPENTDNH